MIEQKKLINKTKNGEKVLKQLELFQFNVNWQTININKGLKYLILSKPNKSHAYLLNVKQSNLAFLKTYNTEFDELIITPTYQNGRPLEIEDKVNLKLLINKQR